MADSEFWRKLADQFAALPEEKWKLCASWTEVEMDGNIGEDWKFMNVPIQSLPPEDDNLQMKFYGLAYEAGSKLAADDDDPFLEWLQALKHASREWGPPVPAELKGRAPLIAGSIPKLADISERVCRVYALRALEDARNSKITPPIIHPLSQPEPCSIGQQIESLRIEAGISQEKLANLIEVDIRNVQKHIAGDATPAKLTSAKYNRVFSNLLKRQVDILQTP